MRFFLTTVAVCLSVGVGLAADLAAQTGKRSTSSRTPAGIPADEKPFWDSAQAFLDAYAKRDAKAIGELFTEDAEFLDEFGERTQGREAIVAMFQGVFKSTPETLIDEIQIERVRRITDNVALEEGVAISSESESSPRYRARYIALHAKGKDGKWRINTLKDRPRERLNRQEHLAQLAWMVGEWVNEDADGVVHSRCEWSDDGNYLLREFSIRTHAGRELNGVQRIGWDPARKKLRSWTFDTEGGFASGLWTKDGSTWLLTGAGVNASGDTVTSSMAYTRVDAEMITCEFRSLIVGGEIRKDLKRITMVKRPPLPRSASK